MKNQAEFEKKIESMCRLERPGALEPYQRDVHTASRDGNDGLGRRKRERVQAVRARQNGSRLSELLMLDRQQLIVDTKILLPSGIRCRSSRRFSRSCTGRAR
jgi:hypothetical protein